MKFSSFFGVMTSFASSLPVWISDASKIIQLLSVRDHDVSFSGAPRETMHIQGRFPADLAYRTGGVLSGLWQKSDDTQSLIRRVLWADYMVLQVAIHKGVFPSDNWS